MNSTTRDMYPEPTVEVQLTLTEMMMTIEALTEVQLALHQIVSDAEPGSELDINATKKLISIIDVRQEMESIVMEALKE
jgi:hypothetical protein